MRILWQKRDFNSTDIDDKASFQLPLPILLKMSDKIEIFEKAHIPVCVIDNLELSHFTTPALADRAPVVVAIAQKEQRLCWRVISKSILKNGFLHQSVALQWLLILCAHMWRSGYRRRKDAVFGRIISQRSPRMRMMRPSPLQLN